MSNTDTYNPPSEVHGELSQIAYDFGYRESKLGNDFWSNNTTATLDSLVRKQRDREIISIYYNIGYGHGLSLKVNNSHTTLGTILDALA